MPEKNGLQSDREITVADLYPDLSPEQLAEAEYRLLQYLRVVKTIFESIVKEKPELLTELRRRAMLRKKKTESLNS